MHIHILGICGTFMGSLAQLAQARGFKVTGADHNVYPPMSTQLQNAGIELIEGFDAAQLQLQPDVYVVGNVVSRGNPLMEAILDAGLPYVSGPQWLAENLLRDKWVLGVSGTHGKTTTATMLAWILEHAGMSPGYLIGGVPGNFATSARLGGSDFFVIEADEYDTAFFDKRSKFVHYRPRTLIINNLEFDHADIFTDLAAIQTQFHHLLRVVPENGLIISPQGESTIAAVFERGCWTPRQTTGLADEADWRAENSATDGSHFTVMFNRARQGVVEWALSGNHNIQNALSAIAAARHVGVLPELACEALSLFKGVKRRMEICASVGNVIVYDDFAHHPTAIQTTLEGLRSKVGDDAMLAIIEPRSNTMKLGVYKEQLAQAAAAADHCIWYQPGDLGWQLQDYLPPQHQVCDTTNSIITSAIQHRGDKPLHIVVMSNGGFEGIHKRLADALQQQ